MYKLVYQDVYLGGAETLLLRIGEFLLSKGEKVVLYCERVYSIEVKKAYEDAGIVIQSTDDAPSNAFMCNDLQDCYITISLYTYLECLKRNIDNGNINRVFYYVVHPYNSLHRTRMMLINKYTFKKYRELLVNSIISGYMFFMDEMCVNEFCKFYGIKEKKICKIVYLPMRISDFKNVMCKKIRDKEGKICFLTVGRAEFPFKGYLKGVIDWYYKISKYYSDVKLVIISSGQEIEKLKEWIERTVDQGTQGIELKVDVKPSELKYYYNQASFFIGHGTTLLEACNCGVPALPVEGYTYELKSRGFFDEVEGNLGVPFGTGEKADKYLTKVLEMNDEEYFNLRKRCYHVFKQKYDIVNFYNYITSERAEFKPLIPWQITIENCIRRFKRNVCLRVMR